MIMSPTVDENLTMDENLVGLKDLSGLGARAMVARDFEKSPQEKVSGSLS